MKTNKELIEERKECKHGNWENWCDEDECKDKIQIPPQEPMEWESEFDKFWLNPKAKWVKGIKDFISQQIKQAEERERNKILNALRYVVAEDEDGYDTLEEIIKVARVDNQSKQ